MQTNNLEVYTMKLIKWLKDKVTTIDQIYHELEKSDDIEILHQYRVNLRQLQSFSKIYSKIDEKNIKKLSKIIKKIIKPSSRLRDLDVFFNDINLIECSLQTTNKLYMVINEERKKVLKEFLHIKNSDDYKNNIKQLHVLISDCKLAINQEISSKIIKKLDNKISKKYHNMDMNSSLENLHSIRMEFKTLRYGLSLHNQCFQSDIELSSKLHDLKILQDLFGVIQDNNTRVKFIKSKKNKFSEEEYQELKDYFEEKIYHARKNLLISMESLKTP